MSNNLRQSVLNSFKLLHKARKSVFNGDAFALNEGRKKINEEYRKHMIIKDDAAIQELINKALEAEKLLRTCVIQAKKVEPGKFRAEIKKDTVKLDNVPYRDDCCKEQK